MNHENEEDNKKEGIQKSERKRGVSVDASIEKAKKVLQLMDNVFNIYIQNKIKELEIVPLISTKKMDLETIDSSYFNTIQKKRTKRKLIMLQKIYIEGNPKELLNEEYWDSKTFINDKASLIEDLSVLLFGVDGLNYKILQKNGMII